MMLSSVARRIYWMARYLERAEDTARLVNVYTGLMLDLPRSVQLGWPRLVVLMGAGEAYAELGGGDDERAVTNYMLLDARNPSSVVSCLAAARESVRTTRDVLPSELWEAINTVHRHAGVADGQATRSARHRYLTRVIDGCQHIAGMLDGTMPHDSAHDFVRLGRMLERADMTTRILDVGVVAAPVAEEQLAAVEGIVWIHVLRALSAYQAYRRTGELGAEARQVATFLLCDDAFPRSVRHCLAELATRVARLPRPGAAAAAIRALQARLDDLPLADIDTPALLDLSDQLQVGLGEVHEHITQTWFHIQAPA